MDATCSLPSECRREPVELNRLGPRDGPQAPTRAPTLRRSMLVLGGILLSVALVAAAALVLITTALTHEMSRVAAEDARLQASLRTKVAVLAYARESDRAMSQRSTGASADRAQAESGLHAALQETRRLATPERVVELDSLILKGEGYVATRERLEAEGLPLGAVIEQSTPALEAIFADLEHLIASDDAAVRVAAGSAREWHAAATVLGVSAGALLLLGFAFAMIGTNLLVQRPLLATTEAIARFAGGDESARTVPSGARELREMAATFNNLADRLARQESDRYAFLGGIAHDLRNPLSALKMATDTVRRGKQPSSPEKVERTLAIVSRQIERLDRMVGDLLDATRIEAGHLELRRARLDLRPLVGHVVDLYRPVSPVHEVVFIESSEAVVAECDPTRIEQVVTNLVSNAIKYSPDGGQVTVSTFAERSHAVVSVSDQGIGIPPEEHGRISSRSAARAGRGSWCPEWASGCPSRARSSRRTEGVSRSRATTAQAPRFACGCPSSPRSRRPFDQGTAVERAPCAAAVVH